VEAVEERDQVKPEPGYSFEAHLEGRPVCHARRSQLPRALDGRRVIVSDNLDLGYAWAIRIVEAPMTAADVAPGAALELRLDTVQSGTKTDQVGCITRPEKRSVPSNRKEQC